HDFHHGLLTKVQAVRSQEDRTSTDHSCPAPFLRGSGALPSVVRLTSAATAQSAPVPIRAVRTSADGMFRHSVNPQPTTKLMTSRPKNTRSRRQRVSSARPASKRIHT